MRNLFSLLLVATLVPASAAALSAQQPQNPTTEHASHTTTHTARKHHKRHHATSAMARHHETTATSRHHARATSMRMRRERGNMAAMHARMSSNYTAPTVLGTPVNLPGISAGRAMPMSSSANNPSGVSRAGRLQRLSNGLITPDAARTIALGRISGGTSVDKIRLRTEDGRQVYDVKVVTPNQTGNEMVRVDAHTGAVLETKNVDNPVGTVKGAVNHAVNQVKKH